MKNTLIAILVIGLLVLGFLFIKEKNKPVAYEPWPETEPATVKPTTNTQSTNQGKLSNVNVVAEWKSFSSDALFALASQENIYLNQGTDIQLTETVDLTGNGIDEGIFCGDGGNNGVCFVMIKGDDGKNVVAKWKGPDGTITPISLLSVGRVRVSSSYQLLPSEHAFYTVSKSNDGEGGEFECDGGVVAYSWDSSTKLFEWNQALSTKYTNLVCN
jgi:hypothetical protein